MKDVPHRHVCDSVLPVFGSSSSSSFPFEKDFEFDSLTTFDDDDDEGEGTQEDDNTEPVTRELTRELLVVVLGSSEPKEITFLTL